MERHASSNGLLATVWALLTLPPMLLHELTHALFSAPWAERLALVAEPRGFSAACIVDWRDGTPRWAVAVAHLAPFAAGLLAGLAAIWFWWTSGGQLPSTATEMLWWTIAAMWWLVFVTPSPDDLDVNGGSA